MEQEINKFNYGEFWGFQVKQPMPHKQKAIEIGAVTEDDIPVMPTLKIIRKYKDIVEDMEADELVSWGEQQRIVFAKEFEALMVVPNIKRDYFDFRQMEEIDGKMVDISAFNTADFLAGKSDFDKARYAKDKRKEQIKDLAIRFSCVKSEEGKISIKHKVRNLIDDCFYSLAMRYFDRHGDDEGIKGYRHYAVKLSEKGWQVFDKLKEIYSEVKEFERVWNKFSKL